MNSHETNLAFDIRPVLIKEESFDEVTPTVYINNEGQLCLHINFNRKHYRQSEMETVGKLFSVLITEMVNKPNAPIVSLSRVSEADLPALMSLSKGEELAYDTSKIRLINQGIEPNDFVAVKMGRVKEFAVAIVGIHLTRIFAISNVGYGYWSRPEMTNAVFLFRECKCITRVIWVIMTKTDGLCFAERFNELVIEPIQNHYDKLFLGEHYDDVVKFYLTIVQLLLPKAGKNIPLDAYAIGECTWADNYRYAWCRQKSDGETEPDCKPAINFIESFDTNSKIALGVIVLETFQ